MSARSNLLMRAYREQPNVVREIIQTASKNSATLSRERVKDYILHQTRIEEGGRIAKCLAFSFALFSPSIAYKLAQSRNDSSGYFFGGICASFLMTMMASTLPQYFRDKQLDNEYRQLKEDADKLLGYKRVRESNQLEFLFESDGEK